MNDKRNNIIGDLVDFDPRKIPGLARSYMIGVRHKNVQGMGVKNKAGTYNVQAFNIGTVSIGFTSKSKEPSDIQAEFESQVDRWESSLIRSGKTIDDYLQNLNANDLFIPIADVVDKKEEPKIQSIIELSNQFECVNVYTQEEVNPWVKRHLELCDLVSTWSKDPSSKFGCFLTDTMHRPLGYGFNGFPRGFADTDERWNDRPFKYAHVIHAEENAILNSNGSLLGAIVYVNGCPCSSCMGKLAQVGVTSVWTWEPTAHYLERWSIEDPATVAQECGITLNLVRRS